MSYCTVDESADKFCLQNWNNFLARSILANQGRQTLGSNDKFSDVQREVCWNTALVKRQSNAILY